MQAAVRLKRSVSQALMARLVTEELAQMGADKTVSQTVWGKYEAETVEPSTIVFRAVARVSGLSESYIAFGNESANAQTETSATPRAAELPTTLAPTKSGLPLGPMVRPDEKKEEKKGTRRRRA